MDKRIRTYAIDIETVSQGKRATEYTDGDFYKLGNVKDPEKREAKLREKRDEAAKKHALSWHTGKVIIVGLTQLWTDECHVLSGHDEGAILSDLTELLRGTRLIGKSSKTFDFPFLVGRYMANRMPVPDVLKNKNNLYDVDEFFGWSSASSQRMKLNHYAHGLELDVKPMDGGQVGGVYDEIIAHEIKGEHDKAKALWKKLCDYCAYDTKIVAEMAERYWRE